MALEPLPPSHDDKMRDAVVATNIGVSAAATGGAAAAASVIASKSTTVGAAAKAGSAGLMLKVGAGAIGVALVGGLVAAGLAGGGGASAAAPITGVPPAGALDESIQDTSFTDLTVTELDAARVWLANTGLVIDELTLTGGEAAMTPDTADAFGGDVMFAARDPEFADLDNDGRLDAVMVVDMSGYMNAHDFLSLVVAWRQTADGPQQVEHSLAFGFGFHQGLWGDVVEGVWVEDGLRMTISSSVGVDEQGGSVREQETIRLAMFDGWLVRNEPTYGAAGTCMIQGRQPVAVSDPLVVRVADSPDSPRIGGDGEFVTAEVALVQDRHSDGLSPARVTRGDGSQTCGWVPNADVVWPD